MDGRQSDVLEKEGGMIRVEPRSLPLILSRKEHEKTNSYSSFPVPWPPVESSENLDQVEELSPTHQRQGRMEASQYSSSLLRE